MIFKYFLLLVWFQIKGILSQNCQLNATHMSKSWIYATKPTPNTWDVLHTDYIKDQTSIYKICNENAKIEEFHCNHGIFQGSTTMECSRRLKAEIVLMTNENSCRRMNGELYSVQYKFASSAIVPLYVLCYSRDNEQALYSRHKSYGFNLAASTYTRPQFILGGVVSRDRANSFDAANIYNTFIRLLGPQLTYIPNNKTLILERGHLVNSQDFPTYDQMDETFKYVNVMPQFRGSNRSNWKRIENWIHSLPSPTTYAEVVTGSFGILTLPHSQTQLDVPMYLMTNNKNPIPLWSYKVVKYDGKCYVFVTLNNDFNLNVAMTTTNCRSVACPSGLQFNAGLNSGISYCCNYYHFVRNVGRQAVLC